MKVAIIDDHLLLLESLSETILSNPPINRVDTFQDANSFLETYKNEKYDLVITDVDMPQYSGAELIAHLRNQNPTQKILVLSMHKDHALIQHLFQLSINGFVSKDVSSETLLNAITDIITIGRFLPAEIDKIIHSSPKETTHLTKREIQIIQMAARGLGNKEIAEACFISEKTVKTHRKNIRLKLGINNTAELVRYAMENKLC